jgi:succinate dehydrogenase/fumarate reductase flavoprotein subunit
MGGVETNAFGETSLAGLFAAGECSCSGLNGAGRLAGNTLTEALVLGRGVGEAAARYAAAAPRRGFPESRISDEEKRLASLTGGDSSDDSPGRIHAELAHLMDEKVGLVRDGAGLHEAVDQIRRLKDRYGRIKVRNSAGVYNYELTTYFEVGSMLNLSEVIALSAQARAESRGAHRRADFPDRDDANWSCHTSAKLTQGSPKVEQGPVVASR